MYQLITLMLRKLGMVVAVARGAPAMPRFSGAPEIAASGDGRLEVFVFDFEIEGPLWHAWQAQWSNSTAWTGWCDVIQSGSWPATVAANGDGTLQLVIVIGGAGLYA